MLAVREELALAVERERDSTASAHTTAGEEARAAVGLQTTADAPAALARFRKPAVGSRVRHAVRGEGTVAEHLADGRTRVEFDSGDAHRYHKHSLHKFTRLPASGTSRQGKAVAVEQAHEAEVAAHPKAAPHPSKNCSNAAREEMLKAMRGDDELQHLSC